ARRPHAGPGLCGNDHRMDERSELQTDAGVGRADRPDGVYELSRTVHRLRLDVLWLWPRAVRPIERDHGIRHWRRRVHGPGRLQRLVVEPLSIRSDRVAVALAHVWRAAADAST